MAYMDAFQEAAGTGGRQCPPCPALPGLRPLPLDYVVIVMRRRCRKPAHVSGANPPQRGVGSVKDHIFRQNNNFAMKCSLEDAAFNTSASNKKHLVSP